MNNEEIEILESKKKGSKRPYVIAIVLALALVVTITATSYAYFSANVINSGTVNNTVVTTTSLEIEFTDGPQVSLENAVPGQYIEKTFKVENKGSGDTTYDVYMSDLINDFADKADLVYTLTSNDGGYNLSTQTQVPDTNTKIVNAQLLRAGEEHNYTLRIEFKETNDNQDDNKNKSFTTIIRVNEVQVAMQQVTLHPNEGILSNTTISLPIGESITNLPTPTANQEGYGLEGWYLDSALTQKITSSTIMTSSITDLYAKYKVLPYSVESGDLDTVGSVVKIANEEFYVIGQEDSTHVKLLSKWNLNVGSNPKETATGLQDSDVRGYRSDRGTTYGNVRFSSKNYWYDSTNKKAKDEYGGYIYNTNTYRLNDGQGNVVNPYVYDSNASIKTYVDTYVTYLNNQGVNVSGRLIKQEELVSLGCNASTKYCDSSGTHGGTAPSWVYQTAYWSGSAYSSTGLWEVTTFQDFQGYNYDIGSSTGVRPVIILEK